jgi:hypothetical protein
MDTYRIGFTGSRYWRKYAPIARALTWAAGEAEALALRPVLVHGACPGGADRIADMIWRSWKWVPESHPADWDNCGRGCPKGLEHRKPRVEGDIFHPGTLDTWCPKAGPRRNAHMIGLGMNVLLGFPVGSARRSGSWSCMNQAAGAGIDVVSPERWL